MKRILCQINKNEYFCKILLLAYYLQKHPKAYIKNKKKT